MALRYLVDTSALKRLGRPEVRAVIEPLAVSGQLGRAQICDLEIGYPARNAEEWDQLVGALDPFEAVQTTAAHVRRALQVQRLLAKRSQRGRKLPARSPRPGPGRRPPGSPTRGARAGGRASLARCTARWPPRRLLVSPRFL